MPNIFRYPKIIFPDLVEHPLYDEFQTRDKDFILTSGETYFIPFDESYLMMPDQVIYVPVVSDDERYVRVPRVHLWLEPSDLYPRGSMIKFRLFISGDISYQVSIYVGRLYIIPMSSFDVVGYPGDMQFKFRDDMLTMLNKSVRFRFLKPDNTILPVFSGSTLTDPLPIFTGLLEVY